MKTRRTSLLGVLVAALLAAVLFLGILPVLSGSSESPAHLRTSSEAVRPVDAPGSASVSTPSISASSPAGPAQTAPAAPEVAIQPTPSVWIPWLPQVLTSEGLSAVDPWQDEPAAARIFCSGAEQVRLDDLDAWVEASVWNREARSVWYISRRLSGQDRIDAVASFLERNGQDDCALLTQLNDAWARGDEAPHLPPLYGDPDRVAAQDRRILARLRNGERTQDP